MADYFYQQLGDEFSKILIIDRKLKEESGDSKQINQCIKVAEEQGILVTKFTMSKEARMIQEIQYLINLLAQKDAQCQKKLTELSGLEK